jgi:hypothetical protein
MQYRLQNSDITRIFISGKSSMKKMPKKAPKRQNILAFVEDFHYKAAG